MHILSVQLDESLQLNTPEVRVTLVAPVNHAPPVFTLPRPTLILGLAM